MANVSAQFSVTVRVELDSRNEPLGKITAAIAESGGALQSVDLVPGAGAEGKRVREFTIDAREPRALGADPARDRLDPRRPGARLHRPHLRDAPRRQDRAAQQVPAEDARRPLDGLHAGRRPGLHRDRRRPLEGVRLHDQEEHRRGRHRRQRRARARRHRPGGVDAGDGGQGDAVQGVRRRRRVPDRPQHQRPRRDRRDGRADRARRSAGSTSRTSRRRAASRSRTASATRSTSPSSTTTSTAPPWSSWPPSSTR